MNNLRSLFGQRLRHFRRRIALTQEELAEAIGVSTEFISGLERGCNAPSFETIEKLSQALDVPIYQFFKFNEL